VVEDINNKDIKIQKAINQINDILELLDDDGQNKIPLSVKKFFENYYDPNIKYNKIQAGVPLKEQNVYEYTIGILTYVVTKYIKLS